MVHKVIVASADLLVNFEEQVRGFWKVDVFFGDRIADDGQPGIQLI